MVHFFTQKENSQRQHKEDELNTWDWDLFLYSFWLQKIVLNPRFYDDARKSHMLGQCSCGCSRTEVRKKK